MSATLEIKSLLSDAYIDITDGQFRNSSGSALQSIASYSWNCPGVIEFTVDSVVAGVSCSVSLEAVQDLDEDHPLLASSPITFSIIPGNTTVVSGYGTYTLATDVQEGDSWEVGYGYEWDATDGEWHPAADFGVILPGETSRVLSAKVTNTGSRNWIWTYASAQGDGAEYVEFRPSGGEWTVDSEESVNYLTEDGYPEGQISAGGYAEFDMRFAMGLTETAANNPFIPTILVNFSEI